METLIQEEIPEGYVRLSVEGFGGNSLVAILERKDLEEKTFGQALTEVMNREYSGKDRRTQIAIEKQMQSSLGYTPKVGRDNPNTWEAITLDTKVAPYIQPAPGLGNAEILRTTVLGSQVLGQN